MCKNTDLCQAYSFQRTQKFFYDVRSRSFLRTSGFLFLLVLFSGGRLWSFKDRQTTTIGLSIFGNNVHGVANILHKTECECERHVIITARNCSLGAQPLECPVFPAHTWHLPIHVDPIAELPHAQNTVESTTNLSTASSIVDITRHVLKHVPLNTVLDVRRALQCCAVPRGRPATMIGTAV